MPYGYIKRRLFLAYSNPDMLVSRKLTKGKRCVSDFRYINTRIAKTNLGFPLVMDMYSMYGRANCEVLSVIDLKEAINSLRLTDSIEVFWDIAIF